MGDVSIILSIATAFGFGIHLKVMQEVSSLVRSESEEP